MLVQCNKLRWRSQLEEALGHKLFWFCLFFFLSRYHRVYLYYVPNLYNHGITNNFWEEIDVVKKDLSSAMRCWPQGKKEFYCGVEFGCFLLLITGTAIDDVYEQLRADIFQVSIQ